MAAAGTLLLNLSPAPRRRSQVRAAGGLGRAAAAPPGPGCRSGAGGGSGRGPCRGSRAQRGGGSESEKFIKSSIWLFPPRDGVETRQKDGPGHPARWLGTGKLVRE